jgi:O-antigen chain-terminating methyltransferase
MVRRCKDKGQEAAVGEALSYLVNSPSNSLGAIFSIHMVEHMPFETVFRLTEECLRVVAPGGIVVFETPNPENLHVGSCTFHLDPTHVRPLPPDLLAFLFHHRRFSRVEVLRLHPRQEATASASDPVQIEALAGAQDFAIVATV